MKKQKGPVISNIDLHLEDFSTKKGNSVLPKPYGEALYAEAKKSKNISVLCADLTAATETDIVRDYLPDQFIMCGIAEANMIGVAAGLARSGLIPFVHSFSVFLTRRCFDQIAMQIAYPNLNVKLIGFMPGIDSLLGVSHQATDDVALMRALPNMTIIEPCDPTEYSSAVTLALNCDGPVYLRLNKNCPSVPTKYALSTVERGKFGLIKSGTDAAIFASGLCVQEAIEAAENLEHDGLSVAVVNASSIKPLDIQMIKEMAARTHCIITAENHSIIGGLGSAISEVLAETGLHVKFKRIGLNDCFAEGGSRDYLFDKYGLGARHIMQAVHALKREHNG
jgi:transketolase